MTTSARAQQPHKPSFETVKAAAIAQIQTLAPRLVAGGKTEGNWYVARCPWRADNKPSLGISLTTARFWDRGMAETGTIVDLVMRLDNCTALEARDRLAKELGLADGMGIRYRPAKPPKCIGCVHCWQRYPSVRYCTAVTLDDEPIPTRLARRNGWACGPTGKLRQQQEPQTGQQHGNGG